MSRPDRDDAQRSTIEDELTLALLDPDQPTEATLSPLRMDLAEIPDSLR